MNHAAPRYLAAKRSVDNRAYSRRVRETLLSACPPAPRIVEAGCGTGVTVPRLLEWNLTGFEYHGVDIDEGVIAFARKVRPKELRTMGYDAIETEHGGRVDGANFTFEVGDALEVLPDAGADLFFAQSFADLVSPERVVETIERVLVPGGLAYLPLTFDGGTIFAPTHPADDEVECAYHAAIDAIPGRSTRAGRRLLSLFQEQPGQTVVAAGSDWIVRPYGDTYPADERYFLECILGFIEASVDPATADLTAETFADWIDTRRRQLAGGELIYVAHQYDLLYQTPM